MSKQFTVTTYDYSSEVGTTIIIDFEDFNTKEEAMSYAKTIEHTISSRTVVRGDYGYVTITRGSRRAPIT
jgi:hypothetical protein